MEISFLQVRLFISLLVGLFLFFKPGVAVSCSKWFFSYFQRKTGISLSYFLNLASRPRFKIEVKLIGLGFFIVSLLGLFGFINFR